MGDDSPSQGFTIREPEENPSWHVESTHRDHGGFEPTTHVQTVQEEAPSVELLLTNGWLLYCLFLYYLTDLFLRRLQFALYSCVALLIERWANRNLDGTGWRPYLTLKNIIYKYVICEVILVRWRSCLPRNNLSLGICGAETVFQCIIITYGIFQKLCHFSFSFCWRLTDMKQMCDSKCMKTE